MIGWNLFQGLVLLALLSTVAGWPLGYGTRELHRRSWWPAAYSAQSGIAAVVLTIWSMQQGMLLAWVAFVGLLPVIMCVAALFFVHPTTMVSRAEPTAPATRLHS
jgi:hypothetical protein